MTFKLLEPCVCWKTPTFEVLQTDPPMVRVRCECGRCGPIASTGFFAAVKWGREIAELKRKESGACKQS